MVASRYFQPEELPGNPITLFSQTPEDTLEPPLVVDEKLLHPFQFYMGSAVEEGVRYESELYGFVHQFAPEFKLQACQLACELILQGALVIVSTSSTRCVVWVSLRSPSYPALGNLNPF